MHASILHSAMLALLGTVAVLLLLLKAIAYGTSSPGYKQFGPLERQLRRPEAPGPQALNPGA